ncbi:MAG: phosphoribosylglycinamide formyltransferase [Bacteroidales bacterium]|nr:phosphoribosylglycinamide formyltransferase [Bacteroidales bacterium]
MKNIAVFASGFGSNFEAIIEAAHNGTLHANIALLVVDKPACYAVERAHNHSIPVFAFNPKDYDSKEAYEKEIVKQLQAYQIDLVALAGYMRLVGSVLLENYAHRIINIHPALLPSFPGTHSIEKAYNHGVKVFGITIHYVDAGMDTGPIIDQEAFKKNEDESVEEVETRIHQLEHQLYPKVLERILNH